MTTILLAALLVWPFAPAPTPTPAAPVVTPATDSRRAFCRTIFQTIDGTCTARMEELGGCAPFRREFCPTPTSSAKKGGVR